MFSGAGPVGSQRSHWPLARLTPVMLRMKPQWLTTSVSAQSGSAAISARNSAARAITLDPNSAVGYQALAKSLVFAGRPGEGEAAITKAMRLNPRFPSEYLTIQGLAMMWDRHHI